MTAPQKIGVLTFHRCINYGSYWQARCLVEGLRARGADAVLLDHDSPQVNRAEWRCAFQPQLPARTPKRDVPLYAAKTRRFLAALRALPRSACFRLDAPEELEPFDLIVVGSDEVWNLSHPWYGGRPIFYGAGLPAARLASYAASFGSYSAAWGLDRWWARRLESFDSISVRDENSRALVAGALGREPALVLDPCLQFPPAPPPAEPSAEPYVAIYGHSFPAWFRRRVRRWAKARGLRLLSIGYRNDWADEQRIGAGPEEFPGLIAASVAVATNFFHGCVFALLAARPFAAALSDYRFNKIRDLMRLIGGEARIASEHDERGCDALLGAPLDPGVGARLAALRRQSDRFLDHVLA